MIETIALLLLIALVPVAVADWISAVILTRAARHNSTALRERQWVAILSSVAVTLYFIVGVNTILGFPWFEVPVASIINRSLLLLIGVIPLRFLWLYWRGRLDG